MKVFMGGRFLVETKEQIEKKPSNQSATENPKKYKVLLLNDDYTPMDFVIEVVKYFFDLNDKAATKVMLQVHHQGKGICGVYSRDVAEMKVHQVNSFSRTNQHPLLCSMEPEENSR